MRTCLIKLSQNRLKNQVRVMPYRSHVRDTIRLRATPRSRSRASRRGRKQRTHDTSCSRETSLRALLAILVKPSHSS